MSITVKHKQIVAHTLLVERDEDEEAHDFQVTVTEKNLVLEMRMPFSGRIIWTRYISWETMEWLFGEDGPGIEGAQAL